jgi:hypothetical protein
MTAGEIHITEALRPENMAAARKHEPDSRLRLGYWSDTTHYQFEQAHRCRRPAISYDSDWQVRVS